MGILEPIFIVAFCPSVARMRGFCRILVFVSLSIRLAVAEPIVTAKSVAFKWDRSYSVGVPVVEEDEEEEDEEDGEALGSGEAADDDAELYPRRIPVNARAHAVAYICTEALKREERICL